MDMIFRGVRIPKSPISNAKWDVRDVAITGDKISAVDAPGKIPKGANEIEGKGHWLLPGAIDAHVHLREPGQENKETIATGTAAAVSGGFTGVACMANTLPVNDSPVVTAYIRERARATAHCAVYPIGAVSKGLKGEELAEIGGMVREGAVAISDDGMPVMNSYLMRKAMDYAKAFGIPVISHAEDAHLVGQGVMNEGFYSNALGLRGNPTAAEEIMIAREIALCRLTGARVHIAHLSSRLGVELVRRAKEEGLPITAEASPHHLTLTDAHLCGYNTHFKMAPPLRAEADRQALIEGLASGVIDLLATDHAPHSETDKAVEFDCASNGIIGLETALSVTFGLVKSGSISESRWLDAWVTAPRKFLGLPAAEISVGARADLVLWDPVHAWTVETKHLHSKSQNSPFVGSSQTGRVLSTWIGGRKVFGVDA